MKRRFAPICLSLLLLSPLAMANGLNLNSMGSRALAMGGAYVGLADDFSAVFWNPAGIAFFEKDCLGFYGTDLIPMSTYALEYQVPGTDTPITLVDAENETIHYLAGMGAYYHPVTENLVAGLGVYVPSGLGIRWKGEDMASISNGNPSINWESRVSMVTIAPTLAFKITDQISLGAALNVNYGMFNIGMHAGKVSIDQPPYMVDLGQYEEEMTGWGYGATVGILVKPSEKFSFGGTFRTQSKVQFSGEATISNLNYLGLQASSKLERDLTWPIWIAGGVAFNPMQELTLTADVQYTQWSELDVIVTDFKNISWQMIMARSGQDKMDLHWKDGTQFRFGAEYRINSLALRGGYYIDPAVAPDETMNILLPNYHYNVVTAGFGYHLNGLQLDFAVEYLMGKEREIDYRKVITDPNYESAMPGTYNMNVLVPNLSVSYKF
ncbi:outer membrane protein transport protein [bacterium]|nr:outer membrane protein transport protein [bacterium]